MPTWSLVDVGKIVFKVLLFLSFAAALTTFSIWFVDFSNQIYGLITSALSNFGTSALPDLLACALHSLGIDEFMTSAFAIFFSAAVFWVTAVGYILAYKLGTKAYDGLFKVLS